MPKTNPIFLMPLKLNGSDLEIKHLNLAVDSIKNQTDPNWTLVIIDDFSDNQKVTEALDKIKEDLKEKVEIIHLEKNVGSGKARNFGVKYANEIGAPFILFLDADDLSDPRRLELVRKEFEKDESVNVVYTSFDVIDEFGNLTPLEEVNKSVSEIIDGHKVDIVEGENAWIQITTKKKYTNLTSCTAVRTSLAIQEPFPSTSVSEDSHTWVRYGAHPGKFVFLRDIKGKYRICRGVGSRSRSLNFNFYEQMYKVDTDGFEEGVKLAKKYGTMGGRDENDLRTAYHVRIALCLLHGGDTEYCRESLGVAAAISRENTLKYIDELYCEPECKEELREMVSEIK